MSFIAPIESEILIQSNTNHTNSTFFPISNNCWRFFDDSCTLDLISGKFWPKWWDNYDKKFMTYFGISVLKNWKFNKAIFDYLPRWNLCRFFLRVNFMFKRSIFIEIGWRLCFLKILFLLELWDVNSRSHNRLNTSIERHFQTRNNSPVNLKDSTEKSWKKDKSRVSLCEETRNFFWITKTSSLSVIFSFLGCSREQSWVRIFLSFRVFDSEEWTMQNLDGDLVKTDLWVAKRVLPGCSHVGQFVLVRPGTNLIGLLSTTQRDMFFENFDSKMCTKI